GVAAPAFHRAAAGERAGEVVAASDGNREPGGEQPEHGPRCYSEIVPLRAELLRFPRDDGGLDLLDLALERVVSLSADEARRLDDPDVVAKLDSLMLLEG